MRAHVKTEFSHLFAGLIALGLAGIGLIGGEMALAIIHLERATVISTAPDVFHLKNQGLAFQRAAVHAPNVLPIYGSQNYWSLPFRKREITFFAPRRRASSFRR